MQPAYERTRTGTAVSRPPVRAAPTPSNRPTRASRSRAHKKLDFCFSARVTHIILHSVTRLDSWLDFHGGTDSQNEKKQLHVCSIGRRQSHFVLTELLLCYHKTIVHNDFLLQRTVVTFVPGIQFHVSRLHRRRYNPFQDPARFLPSICDG